jgi:hypothetical protein
MQICDWTDSNCANLGKSEAETLEMIRWAEHGMCNSLRQKRSRQAKGKVKSMLNIFFDIMRIVQKEFILAGQTVNSSHYCDVLRWLCEHMRRLRPKLWQWKNWLLHHDNAPSHTSFFTREFLTKSNMTVVSHPPYLSLFLDSKWNRKASLTQFRWLRQNCRQCLTPTQSSTSRTHSKWQKHWELCMHMEGDYFEGDSSK